MSSFNHEVIELLKELYVDTTLPQDARLKIACFFGDCFVKGVLEDASYMALFNNFND